KTRYRCCSPQTNRAGRPIPDARVFLGDHLREHDQSMSYENGTGRGHRDNPNAPDGWSRLRQAAFAAVFGVPARSSALGNDRTLARYERQNRAAKGSVSPEPTRRSRPAGQSSGGRWGMEAKPPRTYGAPAPVPRPNTPRAPGTAP